MGYIFTETNNKKITILTTTRQDGFSSIPYDCFNMSYDVGDNPSNVLANRNKLCSDLSIYPYNLIIPKQKSTDKILRINNITDDREADSLYTYNKELILSIIHSNCSPIFIYAQDKEIICAIHTSLNGTLSKLTKKTIDILIKKEKVNPSMIYAFFVPGITFSHMIADNNLINKVSKLGYTSCLKKISDITYFDINLMNFMQLRESGIPIDNITLSRYDTYDNSELFFSSTRDNITGRMLSLIKFKNNH